MSTEEFDDILKQARDRLTPEKRRKLAEQLREGDTATNDGASPKSVYDALNELGIIGSITDGPGDLSTNPKHMEGFGRNVK